MKPEYLRPLTGNMACALERIRLITALRDISAAEAKAMEFYWLLSGISEILIDDYQFEYSAVWLLDSYHKMIQLARVRNTPAWWKQGDEYDLDRFTILFEVIDKKGLVVTQGWDTRFHDQRNRHHYENRTCVLIPIVNNQVVVGVLEAGRKITPRDQKFSPDCLERLRKLGSDSGRRIAQASPNALLKLIANYAINIIGAESASIHINRGDKQILGAVAGKATEEFLQKFPPRANGIGKEALKTRERSHY